MEVLQWKINLFKDLQQEEKISQDLVETFKSCIDALILHIQSLLRKNKLQTSFKTKAALTLHENILQYLNQSIEHINIISCNIHSVCLHMSERQQCLRQIIKYGDPLFSQIETLDHFLHENTLNLNTLQFTFGKESQTLNSSFKIKRFGKFQESKQVEDQKENYDNKNIDMLKSQKLRLQLLKISMQGKQSFLNRAQKMKNFQILELAYVMDDCLKFLKNFSFLTQKTCSFIQTQKCQQQKPSIKQFSKSLGLESCFKKENQNEEVDLVCDEDITLAIPIQKRVSLDLQRIIERDQYLESDNSRSHKTFESLSPSP